MFDDFKELLSIFNSQKVKYLIVGGYAVSFHAQPRATKDIDLLIKPDVENGRAVYAALLKYGAPLAGLTAEDFIECDKFRSIVPVAPAARAKLKELGYERLRRTGRLRPFTDRLFPAFHVLLEPSYRTC